MPELDNIRIKITGKTADVEAFVEDVKKIYIYQKCFKITQTNNPQMAFAKIRLCPHLKKIELEEKLDWNKAIKN